jgi:hypothetical protein
MRAISKTEAVFENRCQYNLIAKLISDGRISLHLIDGKVMLDGDEVAREVARYFSRPRGRKALIGVDFFSD